MTPTEFVIWFKGFVAASNTFNITPKQWDTICEYLEKVKEEDTNNNISKWTRYTLDNSNWNTNTTKND
jgi:hypothetical protein